MIIIMMFHHFCYKILYFQEAQLTMVLEVVVCNEVLNILAKRSTSPVNIDIKKPNIAKSHVFMIFQYVVRTSEVGLTLSSQPWKTCRTSANNVDLLSFIWVLLNIPHKHCNVWLFLFSYFYTSLNVLQFECNWRFVNGFFVEVQLIKNW